MVLGQLVRDPTLSDFPFLSSLASSESPKDRRIWLRVAIDHFLATEHGDSESIEELIDAMTAQLHAADSAVRLEVARKLAPCARAPGRLLAALSYVDSEAGDYVLEHAVAYVNSELERVVSRGGRSAVAVAKRRYLDWQIVNRLAAQDDVLVLIALASNDSARLEGPTLLDLLRRARRLAEQEGDRRLADALLQRGPVGPESALLFLCARPNQRIEILLAAQRSQLGRPTAFSALMRSMSLDELELAAVARQPERFVALLAEALDCERELAQKIVDDATGEPLAVALAALGAANEVLVRILISNDLLAGASYQRIRALARLNNALDRNAAMVVMAALRDEPVTRGRRKQLIEAYPIPAPSRTTPASVTKRAGASPQRMLRK
jgi:hypothetical protein